MLLADVAWQISPECLRFICRDSYLERQGHALKHAPSQGASAFACKPQQVMPQRELWHFLFSEGGRLLLPRSTVKAFRQRLAYVKLKLTRKCGSIYAVCVIARLALRGCFPQTVLSGNLYAAVSFRFHTLFVTREAK